MMKKMLVILVTGLFFLSVHAQQESLQLIIEANEYWWSGVVNEGFKMPLQQSFVYTINMYGDCKWNQAQPLLLSNKGRYIWSEAPFSVEVKNSNLCVYGTAVLKSGKAGTTLKEAATFESNTFLHQAVNCLILY